MTWQEIWDMALPIIIAVAFFFAKPADDRPSRKKGWLPTVKHPLVELDRELQEVQQLEDMWKRSAGQ